MLEKLAEKKSLWDYLKTAKKPIVIYGMGDGALKIMNVLERYEIKVSAFFASDDFQRGHTFCGFPVEKLSQISEKYDEFIILLAFGTFREPLISYLYDMSEQYEFYAPDVPAVADNPEQIEPFDYEYLTAHEAEFEQVYNLLSDDRSREVFTDILNYKLSGKVSYLRHSTTDMDEAFDDILKLSENEHYVDLGAYNGDTIEQFLRYTNGKFASITAFEPDVKNFKKLQKAIAELELDDVTLLNIGSYSKKTELKFAQKSGRNSALSTGGKLTQVDSVDNIRSGKPVTYIKLDVEGAEESAILGAANTIRTFHPKITLSAYHKNSDLFLLPLLINRLCPDYKFFLRHHTYIPAWDTNFYCVFDG